MDLGLIAGVVMLIGWAISTFGFNGPGWVHFFLSAGVFLVIWRYSVLTRKKPAPPPSEPPTPSGPRSSAGRRRISGHRKDSPTGVPLFRARKP
jgi:hypothetical protein